MGDQALLLTVDFFTPMVDDPYDFGRITAANSLSDVYAMGGRPLTAMNLLAFPCSMDADMIAAVLRGGADVCALAGCVVVGGHTIDDNEPKYGLSILGVADPDQVVRNIGALPGDALVMTKRLGVGVLNTALKRGLETEDSLRDVIESMAHLNKAAAEAMLEVGVHAATDITGFGLVGHLHEMMIGSGVAATIDCDSVLIWDAALDYSREHVRPGRTEDVIADLTPHLSWDAVDDAWRGVLADPQTSGGLLMAVAHDKADALLAALESRGESAAIIGSVSQGQPGHVTVR